MSFGGQFRTLRSGGVVAFILSSLFYFVLLVTVFFWLSKMGKQEKKCDIR